MKKQDEQYLWSVLSKTLCYRDRKIHDKDKMVSIINIILDKLCTQGLKTVLLKKKNKKGVHSTPVCEM